jgi:60 kDa SS-A/Ro ribonucleoprotein
VEKRVAALVPEIEAAAVAALAIQARGRLHLRHVSLLLVREMARHASHRPLVAATLMRVIQRADELAEFVAIYWKDGKQPLSAQVKKGLAAAFVKFDGYQLAKYDRAAPVRLRDVLFLCHARPLDGHRRCYGSSLPTAHCRRRAPAERPRRARSQGPNPDRSHG